MLGTRGVLCPSALQVWPLGVCPPTSPPPRMDGFLQSKASCPRCPALGQESRESTLAGFRCTFLLAVPYLRVSFTLVLALLNAKFLACF